VREDLAFELLKLWARLEAELFAERSARASVHIERVGLAPGAVQRLHELGLQAFPQGVFPDELFELWNEVRVAACGEVVVDAFFHDGNALLFETATCVVCKAFLVEIEQRRSSPERQRLLGLSRFSQSFEAL
jgi:hypothetical protein